MIQLTALEDWSVSEKQQWDSAIKFMENTLQDELDKGIRKIKEMLSLENQPHIFSDISPATFSTLHDSTSSFSHFHIQCAHWLTIHFSVWMIAATISAITHTKCDVFALISASNNMYELLGPGATERWLYWKSRSREQVSVWSFFWLLL